MKRRHLLLSGALAICLATVGLAGAKAGEPGLTDNQITIGLFGPLSGPLVGYGRDPLNAARMLYEEVNKEGGINGRKIKLIIGDDKCTPNDLVAVVKKFVTVDKVFALHGGSCTSAVAAAENYINQQKVPYAMLNAAGDAAVFPPTKYVFGSFHGTQRAYAGALATFAAKTLKSKRAAIIVHNDDYGTANLKAAEATFKRLGVEVVATERIPPKITDVTAPMLSIRQAKPDVILSGAYPAPAILIAQKYNEYGMTDIPLLQSTQGIPNPAAFAKNVGDNAALANFYYCTAFTDIAHPEIYKKYLAMYKKYYPDRNPSPFFVSGLPSAMAMIAALKSAGRNLTREGLVAALEKLDVSPDIMAGPLKFGPKRRDAERTALVIKFDGTHQKEMPGAYTWTQQ